MYLKHIYSLKSQLSIVFIISVILFSLSSCVTTYHTKETIEDKRLKQEKVIELHTQSATKTDGKYESLGFGPLHIFKPDAFNTLDSLYALKYKYEQEEKYREYRASGIEELIEDYKKSAEESKKEITYELEHIYSLNKEDQITIHHDYFLLDYNDSIISHTPLYDYTIPVSLKEMQLNYLFELHFLTENERYISQDEQAFIQYYKVREQELIRSGKLQDFMVHTLGLMQIAKSIRSVNTLDLVKALVRMKLDELPEEISTVDFGTLLAHESSSKKLLKYEIKVSWETPTDKHQKAFEFTPYLEYIYK